MKLLAVTACPTGIAQTYMAAEMIESACKKAGIECKVETQGALGVGNVITDEDVKTADACILTTDIPIQNRERFEGIPVLEASIVSVIKEADRFVAELMKK